MRMREYTTSSHNFHVRDGEVPELSMTVYSSYVAMNCRTLGSTVTWFFHPAEDETVDALIGRVTRAFRTIVVEEGRNA